MSEQITALYNIDAEQAVLGSIIVEPELVDDLTAMPDDFYRTEHKMICETLIEMRETGEPIEFVPFVEWLTKKGLLEAVGGVSYLVDMTNAVPTTTNFKYYQGLVTEKSRSREMLRMLQEAERKILSGKSVNDVSGIVQDMQNIETTKRKRRRKLQDVLIDVYEDLEKRSVSKGGVTGIPTGFSALDNMTCGLHSGDLIIVAARPSIGKTAFALNIGQNVARPDIGNAVVGMFSLEMADKKLAERQVSSDGNIDAQHIRTGKLSPDEWNKLSNSFGNMTALDMYYYDDPNVTVQDIRTEVKDLRREHPDRDIVIIIDYLQLIQYAGSKKGNRQEEVSFISRNLKLIAREFKVAMIALSQLSRSVESRQNKRPILSDIRESGSIEQDADVVAFLYRDDYYDKESESKNIIEIIIGKQRNGPVGMVELAFVKEYNKFVNLELRLEDQGARV